MAGCPLGHKQLGQRIELRANRAACQSSLVPIELCTNAQQDKSNRHRLSTFSWPQALGRDYEGLGETNSATITTAAPLSVAPPALNRTALNRIALNRIALSHQQRQGPTRRILQKAEVQHSGGRTTQNQITSTNQVETTNSNPKEVVEVRSL